MATTPKPASQRQLDLIAKLLRERHESSPSRRWAITSAVRSGLTTRTASGIIDELLTWQRG